MIDVAINVIDRLIQLFRERERHASEQHATRRQLVLDVIDPLYSDMEKIQVNYNALFLSVQRNLADPTCSLDEIIDALEAGRFECAPLREKALALADAVSDALGAEPEPTPEPVELSESTDCKDRFEGQVASLVERLKRDYSLDSRGSALLEDTDVPSFITCFSDAARRVILSHPAKAPCDDGRVLVSADGSLYFNRPVDIPNTAATDLISRLHRLRCDNDPWRPSAIRLTAERIHWLTLRWQDFAYVYARLRLALLTP